MTAENEFAPQIARLPGVDLSYREAGTGPVLVFMHAGITDSRSWYNQLTEFAKDYHVIAPDMRGYGQSVITDDIFNYYRDVLELLHLLRIDKVVLVGNSVGGYLCAGFGSSPPGYGYRTGIGRRLHARVSQYRRKISGP